MRELIFGMLFYTWLLFGRSNNYDSTNKETTLRFVRLPSNSQTAYLVKGTHFQPWKKQIARTSCQFSKPLALLLTFEFLVNSRLIATLKPQHAHAAFNDSIATDQEYVNLNSRFCD